MSALPALFLPFLLLCSTLADGWLGVFLAASDPPRVAEVIPGSPAAKAGLKVGDRILAVEDRAVTTRDAFVAAIRAAKPGQQCKVKVDRNGSEMVVVVRLGERPAEEQIPEPQSTEGPASRPEPVQKETPAPVAEAQEPKPARPVLGVALESGEHGLRITRVVAGSAAAKAGLQVGEVLQKFGEVQVADLAALEQQLDRCRPGQQVALQLGSAQGTRSLMVTLGGAAAATPPPATRPLTPKPRRVDAEPAPPVEAPKLLEDFDAALAQAKAAKRPLVVLYGAAWNSSCQAQRRALQDPALGALAQRALWAWIDTDQQGELASRQKVKELPTIEVWVGGESRGRHQGYLPPERLRAFVAGCLRLPPAGEAARTAPVPPRPPVAPAAPTAPSAGKDVEEELRQLRAELREIRQLLEELRKK